MLHEILLSLSGHPSVLFDAQPGSSHVTSTASRLLSPPEAELLSSVGHLSRLHRNTRDHAASIATSHPSTVCRAVATTVISHHLNEFQRKVLDVERRILKQDASTVGAYGIVPLATIAGEFSEWVRLMEWLWGITNFIQLSESQYDGESASQKPASGSGLIDRLRAEAQTGYPDIEAAARYLSKAAETSWLRQLSTWLLYGRLPSFGISDFFIAQDAEYSDELAFVVRTKLLPKFVTRQTAASILFVGRSLNQIRSLPSVSKTKTTSANLSDLELLPVHVQYLSQVTAPVLAATLSQAVANIRLSLSRNLLQHLLPREKIAETLSVLYQFFLIGRGEFALNLIAEADNKISSRHRVLASTQAGSSMKGLMLKEVEINQTLARSFQALSTSGSEDDHTDDILDVASNVIHLIVHGGKDHRPGTPGRAKDADSALPQLPAMTFNELLLSVPVSLAMEIQSPLDLFMTKADLDIYSSINAYLLAVRRAHLHLAQLWRHSSIRREHPGPPNYHHSNSSSGKANLRRRRERANRRTREMRKIWATCAAAIFFLAESEAYFHGEVVKKSFTHLLSWVTGPHDSSPDETSSGSLSNAKVSEFHMFTAGKDARRQHDPEAVAFAHRRFLSSIVYSLLLTDVAFTKALRTFCTHVDEMVAYITRLQSVQRTLDMEEDDGIIDHMQNYQKEEQTTSLEMDRTRRRLDSDLKALVERLRTLDGERFGVSSAITVNDGLFEDKEGKYEPLRVGGIDQLLMKLDWSGDDEDGDSAYEDLV